MEDFYGSYAGPRFPEGAVPGASANGAGLPQGTDRPVLRIVAGSESGGLCRRQLCFQRRPGASQYVRFRIHHAGRLDSGHRLCPVLHGHPPAGDHGLRHAVRRLLFYRQDHRPELCHELFHLPVVHAFYDPRRHRLLPLPLRSLQPL